MCFNELHYNISCVYGQVPIKTYIWCFTCQNPFIIMRHAVVGDSWPFLPPVDLLRAAKSKRTSVSVFRAHLNVAATAGIWSCEIPDQISLTSPRNRRSFELHASVNLRCFCAEAVHSIENTTSNRNTTFEVTYMTRPQSSKLNMPFYVRLPGRRGPLNVLRYYSFFEGTFKGLHNANASASFVTMNSIFLNCLYHCNV